MSSEEGEEELEECYFGPMRFVLKPSESWKLLAFVEEYMREKECEEALKKRKRRKR